METAILCGHCQTPAVAEIDGDYLCAGCLMSILLCLEESIPITPLNVSEHEAVTISEHIQNLKHIYQVVG
jgi:hypothetical protein